MFEELFRVILKMRELRDPATEAKAARLQARADKITRFRGDKAKYLGAAIGMTERRWSTTLAATAFVASDWVDGFFAKKAQKLVGATEPLTDGGIEDPKQDKRLRKALMGGIALRAAREQDTQTLMVAAGVQEISDKRDERMERSRTLAEKHELPVGVSAMNINRAKTAVELTSLLVHISPLAENDTVRRWALAGLSTGTALGYAGEKRYTGIVREQLSERWAACPDRLQTITDVQACTTQEHGQVVPLFETHPVARPVPPHAARRS